MGWKDKDGNEIDTSGADEKTLGVVGQIIEGALHQMQEAVGERVTQAVSTVVDEQVKPLADRIEKLKPAEGGKGGKGGGETDNPVLAAIQELRADLGSLKEEREREKAGRTAREIAERYVAEHRPNLRGKERLIARIAAAGVKSDEDAKRVLAEWDEEMRDVLGEDGFKRMSADPEGEGATEDKSADEKGQAKERLLKTIREREPVAKAG
jgi:hypothetical protein